METIDQNELGQEQLETSMEPVANTEEAPYVQEDSKPLEAECTKDDIQEEVVVSEEKEPIYYTRIAKVANNAVFNWCLMTKEADAKEWNELSITEREIAIEQVKDRIKDPSWPVIEHLETRGKLFVTIIDILK